MLWPLATIHGGSKTKFYETRNGYLAFTTQNQTRSEHVCLVLLLSLLLLLLLITEGVGGVVSVFVAREARRAMAKRRSTLTHDSVFIYIL